ncbi:MAG: acyl-CoA dehydrogenase family protein [Chloroflexi bacterium]|nr:acyl-CoA dehydrogenase family protein [Chloroflexota bacterium]
MFEIPEELRMLQLTARRFVREELLPLEAGLAEGEALPPEVGRKVRDKAKQIGLWALSVPVEYGGAGLGALADTLVIEEFSKVMVPAFGLGPGGTPMPALYSGSAEQKEKYLLPVIRGEKFGCFALTEPTGGSDPGGNMETSAVKDGDHWVINGRKCFVTGGDRADYALVFALTDREKRQHGGVTTFIVEPGTPGFRVVRTIPTMGGIAPAELDFQDCVVPDSQRLGGVGEGFVMAQKELAWARAGIGARAIGMGERLLEMGLEWAKTRITFGKPLAERQAVQFMLADSAIEIDACRWMTYRTAWKAQQGQEIRLDASMLKVFASEMMGHIADRVLQIYGGWGYSKEFPIERFYRIARLWRIVEGPNEVHRWAIARALGRFGLGILRPVN